MFSSFLFLVHKFGKEVVSKENDLFLFVFHLAIAQGRTFPVYCLCSLGIMFVCMSKPAKVAITEVRTRRRNLLGLFPCQVSQVSESGPHVNFSVSQRYFLHLIRKKNIILEHQATKTWAFKVWGDIMSFQLFPHLSLVFSSSGVTKKKTLW